MNKDCQNARDAVWQVLIRFGIKELPERISELCDILLTAARFRAERMVVPEKRSMFGASPLERKVRGSSGPL